MVLLKAQWYEFAKRSCCGQAGASKNGIEEKLLHLLLILGGAAVLSSSLTSVKDCIIWIEV